MGSTYEDQYTWSNGFVIPSSDVEAMEHTDGSISVAFVWNGFSTELTDSGSVQSAYRSYARALQAVSDGKVVFESHFLREFDDSVCRDYVEYGEKHTQRFEEISRFVRREMAETIGDMAMENTIVTVATLPQKPGPLSGLLAKRAHKNLRQKGQVLLDAVYEFSHYLPDAKFLSYKEFERFIWCVYHRENGRQNRAPGPNERFQVNQRLARKPLWDDGALKLGNTYTKVCLVMDYPDASPNWFYSIANRFGCEIHVTQIFQLGSAAAELIRSASQTKKALESANTLGGENEAGKVRDHNAFREFVSENNLAIFNNCYIIKLHHIDRAQLDDTYRRFKNILGESAVCSDSDPDVAYFYWRVSQPGQGHQTAFLRPDHSLQIANMAPVVRFNRGNETYRDCLRITSDAQAVTFGYPPDGTNHQITAAKTGGGKGVENVAKILELYPLGTNFYITEVGASYKWTVEAFGGSYFHLNPNDTVISPFPDWKLADPEAEFALPSDIVQPTIGALMPLLARGAEEANEHHIRSVSEQMMQAMYALTDPGDTPAPTLANFFQFADECQSEFEGVQARAAQTVCDNLDSFLSSSAGSNFAKADSINFDAGIVGVDFKGLMESPELAKFLLVFITLRFKQLAFANAHPVRILMDELHEFIRIDRALMETLMKQLTRMGRKEAGAFHGISQEVMDSALEPGILNSITHREFMYLQSGHREAADLYRINDSAMKRWEGYADPEAAGAAMDFRQCLRMVGDDTYDLHLKFPQSLLDLAHSSPRALALKDKIGKETKDLFERLEMFRAAMEA
jgi:hypothetical protein